MITKTSNKGQRYSAILKAFADFYREDILVLINMLRDRNVTDTEIAKNIGFDKIIMSRRYPRVKKEESK